MAYSIPFLISNGYCNIVPSKELPYNAKTVPASPMKDINTCEDLLVKYSEALTIAALHRFTAVLNISIKDTKDEKKPKS